MSLRFKVLIDRYVGALLVFFLNIMARILGVSMRRDHDLKVRGDILIIKLLGGGSLVMAFPALLGIRRAYPHAKLRLLTTARVKSFAETLGLFDELVILDDSSLSSLIASGARALKTCFASDTVIDLEIYSYLSGIFSLMTMARNRLGFYFDEDGLRQRLHTHRVFFHPSSPLYLHYDRMADLIGARVEPVENCIVQLQQTLDFAPHEEFKGFIAVGCGCSELSSSVRKLSPQQWAEYIFTETRGVERNAVFLGAANDYEDAEKIIAAIRQKGIWKGKLINQCGHLELKDSLRALASCGEFWGIDSSLLHYARLMNIRIIAFFGPADPATRLRPIPGLQQEIHYRKTICSPCVHLLLEPPCHGNNLCMKWLFEPREDKAGWIPVDVDTKYTNLAKL